MHKTAYADAGLQHILGGDEQLHLVSPRVLPFFTATFKMALTSIVSARSFFNLEFFSSSNAFSLRASEATELPTKLGFVSVKAGAANPILASYLGSRRSRFLLFNHSDYLFF
ncbi:hypothetical protein ACFOLL_16265 [Falsochrobactrum ovis]|uniref:hypothetical protein n=1 Tax=Falsochrobactrum ovis TaxID=1293442 RepID=UPI000DB90092|nr:hypothetical protein [Falsochrobactrum ovis]